MQEESLGEMFGIGREHSAAREARRALAVGSFALMFGAAVVLSLYLPFAADAARLAKPKEAKELRAAFEHEKGHKDAANTDRPIAVSNEHNSLGNVTPEVCAGTVSCSDTFDWSGTVTVG